MIFNRKKIVILLVIAAITGILLWFRSGGGVGTTSLTNPFTDNGFSFDENTKGYENLDGLLKGCYGKDCISSIDNPEFIDIAAVDYLEDSDLVFVLEHDEVVRGYPQKILNRHEIVNDDVSDDPIVITFCPLCGSALAFERTVEGEVLDFGVSGFLHNNDLVMYDRQTESLWQQITGEAIVGEYFGTRLQQVSFWGIEWKEFREEYPEASVLKGPLGAAAYARYPYGDYESDPDPLFPMNIDSTIHPKTVVYGVEIENEYVAYPLEVIENEETINDTISGVEIVVTGSSSEVSVVRIDSGEEIPATRLFWFAWKAFRPNTELYGY